MASSKKALVNLFGSVSLLLGQAVKSRGAGTSAIIQCLPRIVSQLIGAFPNEGAGATALVMSLDIELSSLPHKCLQHHHRV